MHTLQIKQSAKLRGNSCSRITVKYPLNYVSMINFNLQLKFVICCRKISSLNNIKKFSSFIIDIRTQFALQRKSYEKVASLLFFKRISRFNIEWRNTRKFNFFLRESTFVYAENTVLIKVNVTFCLYLHFRTQMQNQSEIRYIFG